MVGKLNTFMNISRLGKDSKTKSEEVVFHTGKSFYFILPIIQAMTVARQKRHYKPSMYQLIVEIHSWILDIHTSVMDIQMQIWIPKIVSWIFKTQILISTFHKHAYALFRYITDVLNCIIDNNYGFP